MQLGTRWTARDRPPAAVPEALHAQIAAVEESLPAAPGNPATHWTLTWLERRPIAQLDTGVMVTLDPQGVAVVRFDEEREFG